MEVRGVLARHDDQLPDPERPGSANGGHTTQLNGEALGRAQAELADIEIAYDRALRRGCSERSSEGIATAFDEADRLQRRMLLATQRMRSLELADRGRITAVETAARGGASRINGTAAAVEPRPQR